jgi:hypothetical protein
LGSDSFPHPGYLPWISTGPLEKAAVSANHLFRFVAGEIEEGLIGQYDRIVWLTWIGDQHRHAGSLNRNNGKFLSIDNSIEGPSSGCWFT